MCRAFGLRWLLCCWLLASPLRAADWPGFLGPTADSKSAETGVVAWPETGPRVLWQLPVGTGYGMPSIAGGKLFQFDRHGDLARLSCRRLEDQRELWKFEYPTGYEDFFGYNNGPRCCPVIDDDRVYTFGAEGMLHCVRADDGSLIWKVDTAGRFGVIQNFFGVGSTPVVEGDLLIVHIGGSPPESRQAPPGQLDLVKPNGTAVVAFDKRSGEVRYQLGDDLASYAGPTLATINGRRWCFVLAREGLLAFDPSNGQLDFHYPWRATMLESVNASNPVVVGDLVFISECYGPGSSLLRVRPGGYEVVWSDAERRRDKAMQTHWNTAIHHDGYLYGSSGRHSNEAELRCVELQTGRVTWAEPGLSRSSLLYVDGHFVCLTEYGALLLLKANPEKFDLVSAVVPRAPAAAADRFVETRLLRYPAWAAPALVDGRLYVRGADRLVCFELIPAAAGN